MKQLFFVTLMLMSGVALFSFTAEDNKGKTSVASYYHDKFNGRKTASGEIFDNTKKTAANKTLPFGTRVKITNVKNNKSVEVRVNDRGPFTKGRSFDLSKAAFNKIADTRHGTAVITYEVLD